MSNLIKILYNNAYGKWDPSLDAINLYNTKMQLFDPENYNPIKSTLYLSRHDPILIEVFLELGLNFDNKFSKTEIYNIDKKYEKYYFITNTYGKEQINININKYRKDKIKELLFNLDLSDNEKIELIHELFNCENNDFI